MYVPDVVQLTTQSFPPKPQWTAKDVPDLSDKVILITGGNAGIGKETARICLERGAKVYIAARSTEKAQKAIAELKEATGKTALFLQLDLSDLGAIKSSAIKFMAIETRLHVLFNNAGVMVPPLEQLTVDGYDLQFGTNVLGHYYFTTLLLPILTYTAKLTPSGRVRVVNTSSSAILGPASDQLIVWETLAKGKSSKKHREAIGAQALYAQSKIGNVLLSNELARRYGDQGIVSIALNPGNIRTDLLRHVGGLLTRIIDTMLYDVSYGVLTQLYAGASPQAEKLNGKYLIPWARVGPSRPELDDPVLSEKLWSWLEDQVRGI